MGGLFFYTTKVYKVVSQTIQNKLRQNQNFDAFVKKGLEDGSIEMAGLNVIEEVSSYWENGERVSLPHFADNGPGILNVHELMARKFPYPQYIVITKVVDSFEGHRSHVERLYG